MTHPTTPAGVHHFGIASTARFAEALVETLVDHGPATATAVCDRLGWPKSRFGTAVRYAREHLCPTLDLTIPAPTPDDGWRYCVTDQWGPIGAGAAWTLGQVESRLRSIERDVLLALPQLEKGTEDWRAANLLAKHLPHINRSLEDIHGTRQACRQRGPTPG